MSLSPNHAETLRACLRCGWPGVSYSVMVTRSADTPSLRKARGAFFTPDGITEHIAEWAIQRSDDTVLEPSAGEAAFLVAAVRRLRDLGVRVPAVDGVELHAASAQVAQGLVASAGGVARIEVTDFFLTEADGSYAAVIGNPPFIRYQDFGGAARDRARFAALAQGVALSGLASSWAAFVVHAAAHLRPGGRLGMVLPAELLSTNYAAPIRQFLLERFSTVELVTFETQVFPDAEADTVLVKAAGWQGKPAGLATLRQTRDASTLRSLRNGTTWSAVNPTARWTPLLVKDSTTKAIADVVAAGSFVALRDLGKTSLGIVTGANKYFALSPQRVLELGIPRRDLVRISPPGSSHLRGLALTDAVMTRLGRGGQSTWLLYPRDQPSAATLRYIESGHATGIDTAYKCRVRRPWWRVPLMDPADLLLTYMNADAPRITTNMARVRHLNSVHGIYLHPEVRDLASEVLPIASLNSLTLLSAELVGRSYGGGVLKIEPREADSWWMPSAMLMAQLRQRLLALKPRVQQLLQERELLAAVALVDDILLDGLEPGQLTAIREDHSAFMQRRITRGKSG